MDRMTCIHGRIVGNGAGDRRQPIFSRAARWMKNGALNRRVLGENWLVSVMRPWLQVIRPMTCIHGRATGANQFFPDRPVDEKWGFEPQGVGGKIWLASVVRSVASNATVDAGHPTHDLHTLSDCWQRSRQPVPTIFPGPPGGRTIGFETARRWRKNGWCRLSAPLPARRPWMQVIPSMTSVGGRWRCGSTS